MTARDYYVFGLRVRSAVALPELVPLEPGEAPDVTIGLGAVPEAHGCPAGLSAIDDGLLIVVADVAAYRIETSGRITIDAVANAPERNIRLYLLGSVFGALLHLRGLLPLHANAIEIDGRAAAFMGASGEGKSTLAVWFHDRGFRVIADDVCVVGLTGDGRAFAVPGQQRLRLWREALHASGRDASDYARSFVGHDHIDKFDVPVEAGLRRADHSELACLYVLGGGDEFRVERLSGMEAADAVFTHTYRGHYLKDAGSQQQHWETAMKLVQCVPIFRLARPRSLSLMDAHGQRILDHLASVSGGAGA